MRWVMGTLAAGSSLTTAEYRHDNSGRPNGSTQTANPKFLVNFSNYFEDVDVEPTMATIRARYLDCLSSPSRQVLVSEH